MVAAYHTALHTQALIIAPMHALSWTIRETTPRPTALWPAFALALLLHGLLLLSTQPSPVALDGSKEPAQPAIQVRIAAPPPPVNIAEPAPEKPAYTQAATLKTSPAKPLPTTKKSTPDSAEKPQQQDSASLNASQLLLEQYLSQVKQRIQKEQRYPRAARRRRLQGSVEVSFQWSADGTLTSQSIKSSSGQKVLDAAAIQMLKKASPLPSAPPELRQQDFMASLPINFSIN